MKALTTAQTNDRWIQSTIKTKHCAIQFLMDMTCTDEHGWMDERTNGKHTAFLAIVQKQKWYIERYIRINASDGIFVCAQINELFLTVETAVQRAKEKTKNRYDFKMKYIHLISSLTKVTERNTIGTLLSHEACA